MQYLRMTKWHTRCYIANRMILNNLRRFSVTISLTAAFLFAAPAQATLRERVCNIWYEILDFGFDDTKLVMSQVSWWLRGLSNARNLRVSELHTLRPSSEPFSIGQELRDMAAQGVLQEFGTLTSREARAKLKEYLSWLKDNEIDAIIYEWEGFQQAKTSERARVREQRGTLNDSLSTIVEIEPNIDALAQHISAILERPIESKDITVAKHAYDARIGWDTYIISVKGSGVFGFSNRPISD